MDPKLLQKEDVDWIDLAEDLTQWKSLMNTVINLWVPQKVGDFLSGCVTTSFSRKIQPHIVVSLLFVQPLFFSIVPFCREKVT
jgi:hypothetical protein